MMTGFQWDTPIILKVSDPRIDSVFGKFDHMPTAMVFLELLIMLATAIGLFGLIYYFKIQMPKDDSPGLPRWVYIMLGLAVGGQIFSFFTFLIYR